MEKYYTLAPITILIVEDNKDDIRLVKEALKGEKTIANLVSIEDGEKAMEYLRKEGKFIDAETPDLILLDLNLPKKDGLEVLSEIKNDDKLKLIPVIIMTISNEERDIFTSYNLHANAYIIKPLKYNQFIEAIRSLENFWFTIVKLPPKLDTEGK